jgi:hypothetical protein
MVATGVVVAGRELCLFRLQRFPTADRTEMGYRWFARLYRLVTAAGMESG